MTLEEEVARAACALTGNDPDGDGWEPNTRAWQDEDYIALARAAIAIIEPRAEAEGAAKERAAVVAKLRRLAGDEPVIDIAADIIEDGEHITASNTPPAAAPPSAPSSSGPAPSA